MGQSQPPEGSPAGSSDASYRPVYRLEPRGVAGYRLTGPESLSFDAQPAEGGWTLRAEPGDRLLRIACGDGMLVLSECGPSGDALAGREVGRTIRSCETGSTEGTVVLVEDGRLFRIQTRSGPSIRFELRGGEVSGAYWLADRAGEGWLLTRTPAGRHLPGATEILLLFAAELLRITEPAPEP